ncbi:uncharacterized protein [Trachinotus anak]|uniref:uncharacterized protein isoform X4 n=1 Tax=Trachinotus anak TaxID=443729 RepID=UPI0039F24F49
MNPEFCESSLGGDDEGNLLQPSVVEDLRSRQQRWHGIHRSRRDTQRRRKSKTTRNEREHKKLWRLSGLAVWIDSGLCAGSGWLQNGLRHRTVQQNKRQKLKEAVEQ